jgi:hypothetical protein
MSSGDPELAALHGLMDCYYRAVLNETVDESDWEDPLEDELEDDSDLNEDLQDSNSEAKGDGSAYPTYASAAASCALDKLCVPVAYQAF